MIQTDSISIKSNAGVGKILESNSVGSGTWVNIVPSGSIEIGFSGNNILIGSSASSAVSGDYVHTYGNENVAGEKTFSEITRLNGGIKTPSIIFNNTALSGSPTTTVSQFMASLITGVAVGTLLATTALTVGVTGYPATSGIYNPTVGFPQGTMFECQAITGTEPNLIITAQVSGTGDALVASSNMALVTFHNAGAVTLNIGTINFLMLQKKVIT